MSNQFVTPEQIVAALAAVLAPTAPAPVDLSLAAQPATQQQQQQQQQQQPNALQNQLLLAALAAATAANLQQQLHAAGAISDSEPGGSGCATPSLSPAVSPQPYMLTSSPVTVSAAHTPSVATTAAPTNGGSPTPSPADLLALVMAHQHNQQVGALHAAAIAAAAAAASGQSNGQSVNGLFLNSATADHIHLNAALASNLHHHNQRAAAAAAAANGSSNNSSFASNNLGASATAAGNSILANNHSNHLHHHHHHQQQQHIQNTHTLLNHQHLNTSNHQQNNNSNNNNNNSNSNNTPIKREASHRHHHHVSHHHHSSIQTQQQLLATKGFNPLALAPGSGQQTEILTPTHLRKAKLMFFYVRYPNSSTLKECFPDVRFNKNNTAQLVKWFSNFREFYYIQMEKFARDAIADNRIQCKEDIVVSYDHDIINQLNNHYNKNRHIELPDVFRQVVEETLRHFFDAIQQKRDQEQSWKKAIYKVIARLDQEVPAQFKTEEFNEHLE